MLRLKDNRHMPPFHKNNSPFPFHDNLIFQKLTSVKTPPVSHIGNFEISLFPAFPVQ